MLELLNLDDTFLEKKKQNYRDFQHHIVQNHRNFLIIPLGALHYGIHNNNKQQYSSLFLYDASYIRLKNVEIGYTLPKAWTSKAGIQNVRIYVQGQNLLTFDNLGDVDMDPEIKNGDGSWFPVQRVINIGLNMTF